MTWILQAEDGVIMALRVVPRASKDEVQGVWGDALKVRLRAPPVEGKANEALVEFLAGVLDVPRRCVHLLVGDKSRAKRVKVDGITEATARERLGV